MAKKKFTHKVSKGQRTKEETPQVYKKSGLEPNAASVCPIMLVSTTICTDGCSFWGATSHCSFPASCRKHPTVFSGMLNLLLILLSLFFFSFPWFCHFSGSFLQGDYPGIITCLVEQLSDRSLKVTSRVSICSGTDANPPSSLFHPYSKYWSLYRSCPRDRWFVASWNTTSVYTFQTTYTLCRRRFDEGERRSNGLRRPLIL